MDDYHKIDINIYIKKIEYHENMIKILREKINDCEKNLEKVDKK